MILQPKTRLLFSSLSYIWIQECLMYLIFPFWVPETVHFPLFPGPMGQWLLYLCMLGISCTMTICTTAPQSILLWTRLKQSWLTQMHFVLTGYKENKSSLEQRFILGLRLKVYNLNLQYLVISKMKKTPRIKQNTIMECVQVIPTSLKSFLMQLNKILLSL